MIKIIDNIDKEREKEIKIDKGIIDKEVYKEKDKGIGKNN